MNPVVFDNNQTRRSMAKKDSLATRITGRIIAIRWPLLAIALLVVIAAYGPADQLEFDRSIENMFAPDDPILVPYRQLKRTFGGNEVALAAYVDPELLTHSGMTRLEGLTDQMAAVDGVDWVMSLTTTPLGAGLIDDPVLYEPFLELFKNFSVSVDGRTAAVVCVLLPEEDSAISRPETIEKLRGLIVAHDKTGVLTGEPVMVHDGFKYLEDDGQLLGRASTALLMLTMIIFFRSVRWVLIPVAVVLATLWVTKATLVWCDFRLSMVSSMLWAIVTVTGVAMMIHIIVHFRESRKLGLPPRGALLSAGSVLGTPVLWTCFTDAAGFGSLLGARVGPVQDFGVMMVIGSLVVILSAVTILPGLALWGRFDTDPKRAWGESNLDAGLRFVVHGVERWPRFFGAATIIVVVGASIGCFWLDVETDFTRNFRATSPIVKSYAFVEERLGGAGVWEVIIPAPDELDWDYLDKVRRLENRLRSEVKVRNDENQLVPGLTKLLALVDAVDMIADESLREFLSVEAVVAQFEEQMPDIYHALSGHDPQSDNRRYLRIMLRARERQPAEQKNELIRQVREISREEFPEAQVTGFFILMTRLVDSMVGDQWRTFTIACIGIGCMMLLAFRSLVFAVISVIPNMLPVLVVTGLMGWLGVRVNMGAAMIAAVSMGLSVDSSIHYITAFRRFRDKGKSVREALDLVHQSVGRAMVFSTLALVVGFSALCLSQFVPLIYFGVLVCLTMTGGLLGNLVVLPLLLRAVARERS